MAISDYANLKTAVYNWLQTASGDYTGTTADELIAVGEARIFREIRCREMEATLTSTVTISGGVVPLPDRFVDLKYATVTDGIEPRRWLRKATAGFIYERYPYRQASSRPAYIAREGTRFIFGPYPDASVTYTIGGYYWKRPTPISTSANPVFAAHPDLYLAAALAEATPFIGMDSRIPIWEGKYQSIKKALLSEVNDEAYEGSHIRHD